MGRKTGRTVIHKACRPKWDYIDPTLCRAGRLGWQCWQRTLINVLHRARGLLDDLLHKNSRTRWEKVTCSKCLSKMPVRVLKGS